MSPILGIWASQISGRLWEPQGAYDALSTVTVPSGGVASVTFTGIPSTYKHLQIRMSATYSGSVGSGFMSFNGDNASGNYSYHAVGGDGIAPGATALTYQNQGKYTGFAGTSPAGPNAMIMDILDYSNVSKF